MATNEEIKSRVNHRIAENLEFAANSFEEFSRKNAVEAAREFNLTKPEFRTALQLRFLQRVDSHDLEISKASVILKEIHSLVEESWLQLSAPRHSFRLFLSPHISPGSTVVTLYGSQPEDDLSDHVFGSSLPDTALDTAINNVFNDIDVVINSSMQRTPDISAKIGKRLYSFSRELLENDLELDLKWIRPSGKSKIQSLNFEKISSMKNILDRENRNERIRSEDGLITQISNSGEFRFKSDAGGKIIESEVPVMMFEELRNYWNQRVHLEFREILLEHPQRDTVIAKWEFIRFSPAATQGRLEI